MKKLIIFPALLVGALVGLVLVWYTHHPKTQATQQDLLVAVSPVTVGTVPQVVQATGTLVANQQTEISPKVGGYIKSIHFQEGEFVKAGAVLLTLEDRKEQQAYRSSQAQAVLDEATYRRYLKLRQSGVISRQDMDQYSAKFKQSKAAQKSSQAALQDMQLVAPFDGYLGARSVSLGNYVNVGQNLLSLTDTDKLRVEYSLPSRYASLLKVGQPVLLTSDYLPDQTFQAVVSYVAPFIDANTQTLEVHASFDNHAQQLKPGQSINLTQRLGEQSGVVLIPADALLVNINGSYVYQVQNNKVVPVPVTVGDHYQDKIVVQKGLTKQDEIMTQGQFQVKPGQVVRVMHAEKVR